jgi:hypothetical protein
LKRIEQKMQQEQNPGQLMEWQAEKDELTTKIEKLYEQWIG